MSSTFRNKNGLKQIDVSPSFLFTYPLEDAFRSVHDVFVTDVNKSVLGESIHIVKRHTEAVLVASKDVGLEKNYEKTKDMFMSGDQNAGHNQNIKVGN